MGQGQGHTKDGLRVIGKSWPMARNTTFVWYSTRARCPVFLFHVTFPGAYAGFDRRPPLHCTAVQPRPADLTTSFAREEANPTAIILEPPLPCIALSLSPSSPPIFVFPLNPRCSPWRCPSPARSGEIEKALALLTTMRPARPQEAASAAASSTAAAATYKPSRANASAAAGCLQPGGGGGAVAAGARGPRSAAEAGRGGRGGGRGGGGGPRADVFTWSGAMTACIEGGQWQRAVEMLEVGAPWLPLF